MGIDGITNYFHFFMSGHVAYYMFRYRNLYKYACHGLEANNQKNRAKWHRTTNRGGGAGNKGELTSKLKLCMKMCARQIGWYTGIGESFFTDPQFCQPCAFSNEDVNVDEVTSSEYATIGESANQWDEYGQEVIEGIAL